MTSTLPKKHICNMCAGSGRRTYKLTLKHGPRRGEIVDQPIVCECRRFMPIPAEESPMRSEAELVKAAAAFQQAAIIEDGKPLRWMLSPELHRAIRHECRTAEMFCGVQSTLEHLPRAVAGRLVCAPPLGELDMPL